MRKYPGNYFIGYIEGFDASQCAADKESLTELARLFITNHGIDELVCVVNEIKEIIDNDDWQYFVKLAAENRIDIEEETLKDIALTTAEVLADYRKKAPADYTDAPEIIKSPYEQSNDYIDQMVEWQEHQYVAGYYTGGRIPPFVTKPGKPGIVGMILIVTGSFTLLMFVIAFIVGLSTQNVFQDLASSLALVGAGLAQLFAGLRYIKRQRKVDKQN